MADYTSGDIVASSTESLAVMSQGIPTRVRETELKIRHPGGF